MNERIKELRKQASDFAEVAWAKQTQATWETNKDIHTFYDEKFAELIVRECADIALKSGFIANKNIAAKIESERIYYKIKEHFGVEE
jgi:hypothetical protein